MAAATRSLLERVSCTITTRVVSAACSRAASGELSTAPIRGSLLASDMDSLATSSDCSTMRAGPSTGSIS